MSRSLTGRFRPVSHVTLLALAVMALAVQLALGATVPQPLLAQARAATLDAAIIFCHPPTPADTPRDTPFHHPTDCPLCPLCQALEHSAILLASAPLLTPPPPVAARQQCNKIPPARAPPPPPLSSASPRGPPLSI